MNSTKLSMTVQIPSGFGMPACGHRFGVTTPAAGARVLATTAIPAVVRDRVAVIAGTTDAVEAGTGLAQSYFPGTSAWRPPTC